MNPVNSRVPAGSSEADFESGHAVADGTELMSREPSQPVAESRVEEEPLASFNPASRSLVEQFERSRATSPPPLSAATPPTENNSSRTAQRNSADAYAESGTTQGGDSFAGAAALKTRDPKTGVDAEVFTVSGQVGEQNELQAGMARMGYSGERNGVTFAVSGEALTVRATGGVRNDDNSKGANLGLGATAAGFEVTVGYSGWSVSAGLAVSVGGSASSGERDSDGDGVPERCFKASVGPNTLGFCSEL